MAAGSSSTDSNQQVDRISSLYPKVDESETPLPRCWSPKDKFTFIGLSQNNLRVHYKGVGKTHKDAASVRATHPIPPACGLYYFEVRIVSKGRDGYMGIGLSAQGVNMNRLPGWEKNSYGFHGDDGHSFCSSGTGKPYGPTFTTGDIIGCGLNLIDNTCFYTKNGVNLGIAFRDLPSNLYPTVGLQTPGEVVDANFGQLPFIYNIDEEIKEIHSNTRQSIERHPICDKEGQWQSTIQKIVSTYLRHHGYCATAEAFDRSTGQTSPEELASIKNRQRIQKLVLAGRMGEAIEMTQALYPGLLERDQNLLFVLKCRQFVEMVSGNDSEVRPSAHSPRSSPNVSPTHSYGGASVSSVGASSSGSASNGLVSNGVDNGIVEDDDAAMEVEDVEESSNGSILNGDTMPDDQPHSPRKSSSEACSPRQLCCGNRSSLEKVLSFGRDLQNMSVQLRREHGKNESNKKALQDAFSLLAYSDPWSSPVGYLLDPVQREPICSALNSAILESHNMPRQPPLDLVLGQAQECLKLMSKVGLGACAFASVEEFLQ
ncbi:ran-binding protein 9 [Exaiptasia diaphana]|uniref:Ran-binding protein 9 n=1 Tax=Exaiptasia diaphana TaxID=2652724 RepID=A0A913Y7Z5_EXADI|nr:ran-binding protein 9 [Exaiptasia diaphana]KXJ22092.1 Ran-binding protein 9 [Exaiptasia diaphana]